VKKGVLLIVLLMLFPYNVFAKDYVIGDGDTLQISVWGSPELSLSAIVRPDGKISIPAVGEIRASGMTPVELKAFLEKEMTRVVKTPIVTIIVTGMTNYRIFVFGKGAPAGVRVLARETTLLEFLSQLGPLDNADLERSYLVRNKKKIKSNFYELYENGDYSQDVVLEFNDMLFIPDNFEKRISIVGAVKAPMTFPYREGLTILDVILSAGGFNEFAKENDVEILRKKENGKKEEISVRVKDLMKGKMNENVALEPGDLIIVKEAIF